MQTIDDILGSRTNIAILRHLSAIRGSLSGNEIAKRLGLRESSVRQALQRLVASGIVTRADIGNTAAYELDRDLESYRSVIEPLFRAETQLQDKLIGLLTQSIRRLKPKPRAVILFGSLARGARDFRDVDLLCIVSREQDREPLHETVASGFEMVRQRYNVPVSAVVATEAGLRTERLASVLAAARRDGILLFGVAPKLLGKIRGP